MEAENLRGNREHAFHRCLGGLRRGHCRDAGRAELVPDARWLPRKGRLVVHPRPRVWIRSVNAGAQYVFDVPRS